MRLIFRLETAELKLYVEIVLRRARATHTHALAKAVSCGATVRHRSAAPAGWRPGLKTFEDQVEVSLKLDEPALVDGLRV
mmetsp:Transcript_39648/g.109169  ORF Transcript_39648/g.109169 Transcript_39648/m.109169 type:complete len:80 (+) Transcript_39648:51-290(+)